MILKYIGKTEYIDPFARFTAVPGDLIDYVDDEAEKLLKEYPKLFILAPINHTTEEE